MQLDALFSGTVRSESTSDNWQNEPKALRAPNGYELAARILLDKDDRWELYAWKVLASDVVQVTGAIPIKKYADGRRVWPKGNGDVATVSDAKMHEALRAWESRCGSCAGCGGDGREFAGWNRERGYRYQTCRRCGGSGKPKGTSR